MLLEYHITYKCPLKEDIQLSLFKDKVTNGRKAISTIHSLTHDINQDYKAMRKLPATSERLFDVLIMENKTTLGELYDSYKPFDEKSIQCESCVLSIGEPFACYDRFSFPLSGGFEKWVMERVAKNDHKLFVTYILSRRPRKSLYEDMRRQGFLGLEETIKKKFRIGILKRAEMTSDDLLDFLFAEKPLTNGEILLFLKATGLIHFSKKPKDGYVKMIKHDGYVEWKGIKFDQLNKGNKYDSLLHKMFLALIYGFHIEFCFLYHQRKKLVES